MNFFIKEKAEIQPGLGFTVQVSIDLYQTLRMLGGRMPGLAVGVHEDVYFSEVKKEDVISMFVFDTKKKNIRGLRLDPTTRYVKEEFSDANLEDRIAALAAMITWLESEGQVVDKVNQFHRTDSAPVNTQEAAYEWVDNLQAVESALAVFLHTQKKSPIQAFNKVPGILNLSQVETGMLTPSKIIIGNFEGFKAERRSQRLMKMSDVGDKFYLYPGKKWEAEREKMIPMASENESANEMAIKIVQDVKDSWNSLSKNLRFRNILLFGPKGTGKSVAARQVATMLGLPFGIFCCFADMDSSHVYGSFLPVVIDEKVYEPTEDEVFFDPAGCYEKVTKKKLSEEEAAGITEDMVWEAVEAERARIANTPPRYTYFPSAIVDIFENGGICEIQEPATVRDAGVLIALNSALEEGILNLPHKTIKRHEDCIFILTTNSQYAGCRSMDESFIDRMQITEKVEMPSHDEQVNMLRAATNCQDEQLLHKAIDAADALNGFFKDNSIKNSVSMRGLTNFISLVSLGRDIRSSAMRAFVNKTLVGEDEISPAEIETFLETSTNLFA